jgi:hypothetical protein
VVVPTGTGHWFTGIGDHIDYLLVRIDPDKVTRLKSEGANSRNAVQAATATAKANGSGMGLSMPSIGKIGQSVFPELIP